MKTIPLRKNKLYFIAFCVLLIYLFFKAVEYSPKQLPFDIGELGDNVNNSFKTNQMCYVNDTIYLSSANDGTYMIKDDFVQKVSNETVDMESNESYLIYKREHEDGATRYYEILDVKNDFKKIDTLENISQFQLVGDYVYYIRNYYYGERRDGIFHQSHSVLRYNIKDKTEELLAKDASRFVIIENYLIYVNGGSEPAYQDIEYNGYLHIVDLETKEEKFIATLPTYSIGYFLYINQILYFSSGGNRYELDLATHEVTQSDKYEDKYMGNFYNEKIYLGTIHEDGGSKGFELERVDLKTNESEFLISRQWRGTFITVSVLVINDETYLVDFYDKCYIVNGEEDFEIY